MTGKSSGKTKIGIVGCGNISGIYCQNAKVFHAIEAVACADLDLERAKARALEFAIPRACSVQELLADESIEIVLNLTVPKAHVEIDLAALEAGKSVYSEKPLALELDQAAQVLALAKKKKLRVGCAPDTFLGGGLQTCRKLIDDGWIGRPVAGTAFMTCHGHESWHPSPEFYYERGGGPMLDMGPYYLTALVNLLGPVRRVTGSAQATFPERLITSQPKHGRRVKVETPTHFAGVMDFAAGAVVTIIQSFDIWAAQLPRIEIYGTEGSLSVPDPNTFGGPVRLCRAGSSDWLDVPLSHYYADNSRGLGLADLALALRSGRPHRASGELAAHVLEVMLAFEQASNTNRHLEIKTTCERPAALPLGLRDGSLDD
jgi:predicted dehydrogenase